MSAAQFLGWLSKPFIDAIDRVLDQFGRDVAKGEKICSKLTRQRRRYVLLRGFSLLLEAGYRLENPSNFREKHMCVIARALEKKQVSAAYIQNVISVFRTFSGWIGKKGMIGDSAKYVENAAAVRRSTVAQQNRGWQAHAVSVEEVIKNLNRYDTRLSLYVSLAAYFGLRLQEALCFRPFQDIEPHGAAIVVRSGTKGGRPRLVFVTNDKQRQTLEEALKLAQQYRGSLMLRGKTLDQNRRIFQYEMKKMGLTKSGFGVTFHGLRHDFAQQQYREITGQPTPIEGGVPNNITYDKHKHATLQVMERLGHSRADIGAAYYGSFGHSLRLRKNAIDDEAEGEFMQGADVADAVSNDGSDEPTSH